MIYIFNNIPVFSKIYSSHQLFTISYYFHYLIQISEIFYFGINTSDHLPICYTCNFPITKTRNVYKSTYLKCTVKDRWDKAYLLSYFNITGSLLHKISVPVHLYSFPIDCKFTGHRDSISQYYNSIVTSLCGASLHTVTSLPFKYLKPFSSDRLKDASLDMHSQWCQCGKPRSGIINSARLKVKFDYECAIKKSVNVFKLANTDEISDHLLNKEFGERGISNSKIPLMQQLVSRVVVIPWQLQPPFGDYYSSIYVNSASDSSTSNEFNDLFTKLTNNINNNDAMPNIIN